jgi:hypothetical protein
MPTSASTIFCRVNGRRPCLICGKPDWCSYTRDERISICMRVGEGARKIDRHGGAIYVHGEKTIISFKTTFSCSHRAADAPQSRLAPIEVRDFVYDGIIRLSPATRYRSMLIASDKGLLARGLNETQFINYGGLPPSWSERERLSHQLLREANDQLQIDDSLRGVPGFWEDARGFHLWKEADYPAPRLLIPVRDGQGRIQACQMRLPFVTKKTLRYCWLSSSDLPHGAGSGSPLHFNFRPSDLPLDATIVIVEGALKADALSVLRPELRVIATAGIAANHPALIEHSRGRRILIGCDQDYHINEAVCLQLAALIARRMKSEATLATTRIAAWDRRVKGIDDAALRNLPIISISAQRWFNHLSPDFQRKAASVLNREQK